MLLKTAPNLSFEAFVGTTHLPGLTTKFLTEWHGPWRILAKLGGVNYKIPNNTGRRQTQVVHVQGIKRFYETLFDNTEEPPLLPEESISGG